MCRVEDLVYLLISIRPENGSFEFHAHMPLFKEVSWAEMIFDRDEPEFDARIKTRHAN